MKTIFKIAEPPCMPILHSAFNFYERVLTQVTVSTFRQIYFGMYFSIDIMTWIDIGLDPRFRTSWLVG